MIGLGRVKMKNRLFSLAILMIFFFSCTRQAPTVTDGTLSLKIIVTNASGLVEADSVLGYTPVSAAKVEIVSKSLLDAKGKKISYQTKTDSSGLAVFTDIIGSEYTVSAEGSQTVLDPVTGDWDKTTLRGNLLLDVYQPDQKTDTVKAEISRTSDLVINEIYFAGPVNKSFYFYDQFVELYNASEDTVYLDGMIICRARQFHRPDMDDIDFMQAIYVYQFPGEPLVGREYSLAPGTFSVIAQDAFDHSKYIDGAVDLSGADWEFYNPYAGDWDSPAPNVNNAIPGNGTDFMINVVHNAIILADGSDYYNGEVSESGYQYIHIPLNTVLDAVEYSRNPEKQKEITLRVDAGFAGVGIGKYSGKSTERRQAGFDTNNSSLDFVNLNTPTPGWQHQ